MQEAGNLWIFLAVLPLFAAAKYAAFAVPRQVGKWSQEVALLLRRSLVNSTHLN
jgi:hypothetical protein